MPTFKREDQEQLERAKDLLESAPAGQFGFAKSLFFGRLRLADLMPYPRQDAEEASRTDALIAQVEPFLISSVDAADIDRQERIPQSVIDGMGRLGVMGMTVPREFGGGGFGHTAYCRVLERISRHCASTAVMIGAHQSIGLKALALMGTEAQKRQFLPDLASGRKLAAFCLSEPEVGSDAANVQTQGRRSADGSGWILNGEKKFATNAALAGMLTVMARTPVIVDGVEREKITAFLVTPDLPGFEIVSPNRSKCGIRGSWQATLRFNDMPVADDRILGTLGKGLKVALGVLDYGRCTLCAGCVGGASKALEMAIERANSRRQFGRTLAQFGLVKAKISEMAQTLYAMRAMTYLCAGLVDQHVPDLMLETTMAKLFCSEGAWRIIDDAVQIWGGEGYMADQQLERMLRDARINRIVEGATEVMTAFVALAGMKGVGEEFEQVLRASKHPMGNFGRLAQFARGQWRDIVVGADYPQLHPQLQHEGESLARLTTRLAREVSRLLRTYRQDILDMQLLQQRIAWSAVNLFAMAAVISRLQATLDGQVEAPTNGHNGNGHAPHADVALDLQVGKAFCRRAARQVVVALRSLFRNDDLETLAVADSVLAGRI